MRYYRSLESSLKLEMAREKKFSIVVLFLFSASLNIVFSEKTQMTYTLPQNIQDSDIVMSMLKIVDTKYDSITNRLSGLEMAVQGLLQSNLRESRMVDRNLRGVNGIMQGVHDHLKQLDSQQGLLRKAIIGMSTRVENVYEKTADFVKHFDYSGTKESPEEHITRIERNMAHQTTLIKEAINKTADWQKRSLESERKRISRSLVNVSDGVLLVDAKVDAIFTVIEKLSESKHIKEVNTNLNRVTSSLYKVLARNSTMDCGKKLLVMEKSIIEASHILKNISQRQQELAPQCPAYHSTKKVEIAEAFTQSEDLLENDNEIPESTEEVIHQISPSQWNLLFKTLANMTIDLANSINYYRHTGDLVETMLSKTSMFTREQTLTKRIVHRILATITNEDFTNLTSLSRNNIPNNNNNNATTVHKKQQVTDVEPLTSLLRNMSEMIKNGSSLLELLTELTELSTETLAKTSSQMTESVNGLINLNTSLRLLNQSKHQEEIVNNTRKTFQLLEAVSRSTGWIPYIYHKSLLLENKMNSSNKIGEKIYRKVSDCEPFHSVLTSRMSSSFVTERKDIGNRIRYSPSISNVTKMSSDEALDKMYFTSLKVERILPALTKLVAEPEPLYSLTNGTNPSQGRVEVYMKGRWGTICQETFGHTEASLICRHLGYPGGIAAGEGYFGPGSGLFYALNTSCLQTGWCASVHIVENSALCNHDSDVSVTCEHMIQFTHVEDNNMVNVGTIEIYHQASWTPICGYKWSTKEARVACRQLGYTDGRAIDGGDDYKVDTLWLSDVTCSGQESRIDLCEHSGWRADSCRGSRAAAVACR